jgi:hypothetical protein
VRRHDRLVVGWIAGKDSASTYFRHGGILQFDKTGSPTPRVPLELLLDG